MSAEDWTEPLRYRSDDRDLEGHDLDLVISMGGNGDWYVSIVKHGEPIGPCVRVTTSGALPGKEAVAGRVAELYKALMEKGPRDPRECTWCWGSGVCPASVPDCTNCEGTGRTP